MRMALLLLLVGCATTPPPPSVTDAPIELTLPALRGEPIDLAALRGQVVLIDLMATWSVACQAQQTIDKKLLKQFGPRGFTVVSIAMDVQVPQLIETYVDTLGIPWPVALATPELAEGRTQLGRANEVPRTIILDRKGYVRFDHPGTIPEDYLVKTIAPLL